ncbi:hypothetical protein OPV22_011649 [Ensete ventricosum]|uniref:Uncharacterized protein n=1 Tax=Ensete ventricosum TaxID=4639 RepID=A0AAV8RIE6_ENSVE|nr:hypothetical protein OPV22_011649 [Ensete ventricosum]
MAAASPPTPTTSSSPQVRQLVLHQMLSCALLLLPGVVKTLKWWSAQSPLPKESLQYSRHCCSLCVCANVRVNVCWLLRSFHKSHRKQNNISVQNGRWRKLQWTGGNISGGD